MARLFVQFVHPGAEPDYGRSSEGTVPWNTSPKHKRKCIKHPIRYWCEDTQSDSGPREMYFWGEWEPASRFRKIEQSTPIKPRAIHEIIPLEKIPSDLTGYQNTDPFVFGDRFMYTTCQQLKKTSLREMDRGSIVVFGSYRKGSFCIDTVFVVSHRRAPFSLMQESWGQFTDSELYRKATILPLKNVNLQVTGKPICVYGGQMSTDLEIDLPIFSFVPCCATPFVRPNLPSLEKTGRISKTRFRGIHNSPISSLEESSALWNTIVKDIKRSRQELRLGTSVLA